MCKENDSYKIITDEQIHKYEKLVYKIVNRMNYGYVDKEDLIQAGLKPSSKFTQYLEFAHKLHLANVDKETALKQILGEIRNNKI